MEEIKLENISDSLRIYQGKDVFSYGTDAVLLAAYAASSIKGASGKTAVDLCSGTGIIGLMLLDRFCGLNVKAVEINERAAELSEMSAHESGLSDRYTVYRDSIKNIKALIGAESAAFVVCNPPYMSADCGKMCSEESRNIARHEILCDIDDVFGAAYHLLKTGGRLFIVYRPDRISNLIAGSKRNGFEIKRMTLVSSVIGKAPNLILCEAKKQAKDGTVMGKNFYISDENGDFTPQMLEVRERGVYDFG